MNGIKLQNLLDKLYPPSLAEEWDNIGLQVGTLNKELENILVSLDITMEVVQEAIKNDVQLIIVHHPLIFSGIKNIKTDTYIGKVIEKLIKNDITLYVAHTNFDSSNYGMNSVLSEMIGLRDTINLEEITDNEGIGKVGYINETNINDYVQELKKIFKLDTVKFIGNINTLVKKVAIVGGSGSMYMHQAKKHNVDLFITGDVTYHKALDAKAIDLNILDVGHNIEKVFIGSIKKLLSDEGVTCNIIESEIDTNPYINK